MSVSIKKNIKVLVEFLLIPFVFLNALLLLKIRKIGIAKFKYIKKILLNIGIFPIIDHYYEPLFITKHLKSLKLDRELPGIDWNLEEQLSLLNNFNYNVELEKLELNEPNRFRFDNSSFKSGDAEYYYNIIRYYKPNKIIEIGSGNSTLLALEAIKQNRIEGDFCDIVCIEPYEAQWLEKKEVKVIRRKAEEIEKKFFLSLNRNDILFIDSSHIIRPQGDVLYEYLEILPILNSGVLIHIHDIFTPKRLFRRVGIRQCLFLE